MNRSLRTRIIFGCILVSVVSSCNTQRVYEGGAWELVSGVARVDFRIDPDKQGGWKVSFPEPASHGSYDGNKFGADVHLNERNLPIANPSPFAPIPDRSKYSIARFIGIRTCSSKEIIGVYESLTSSGMIGATGSFKATLTDY